MLHDDDEIDERTAYPRLSWLNRWLSGQQEGRVVHPKAPAVLPARDLYARKLAKPETPSVRELLGEEHFTQEKQPKIKLPNNVKLKYDIGMIARAMGRQTGQVRQWETPPPGAKRRLPRAHRTDGGYRRYTEAEFLIIMEWARKEDLMRTRDDGTVRPLKRPLDNFAARVADGFDMIRDGSCTCGWCKEPRKGEIPANFGGTQFVRGWKTAGIDKTPPVL